MDSVRIKNGIVPIVYPDHVFTVVDEGGNDVLVPTPHDGGNATIIDLTPLSGDSDAPEITIVKAETGTTIGAQLVTFLSLTNEIIGYSGYDVSFKNCKISLPANCARVAIYSYGELIVTVGDNLHTVVQNELLSIMKKQESELE